MCIIVDTNVASSVFEGRNLDFQPVLDWLSKSKDGRIVIGGKLEDELRNHAKANQFLLSLNRAGRTIRISKEQLSPEINQLSRNGICCSNDIFIIALARISGARILCSLDFNLCRDFRNKKLIDNPRGKIYRNQKHKIHLGHTSSCRKNIKPSKT